MSSPCTHGNQMLLLLLLPGGLQLPSLLQLSPPTDLPPLPDLPHCLVSRIQVAIPVSCAVVLLVLMGFGVRRYQQHKHWGRRQHFLDLQAGSARDWGDTDSTCRAGESSRRLPEEERGLKACDPSQRVRPAPAGLSSCDWRET